MKLSIKSKLLLTGIVLGLSSAVFAMPNITGNWKCTGYDPMMKKDFHVSGEIQKNGDVYSLVNWKDNDTNDARSGTALHNKALKDSLAVMFWDNDDAEKTGFGIYQIKSANKIVGTWTMKNGKVATEETCERVKA